MLLIFMLEFAEINLTNGDCCRIALRSDGDYNVTLSFKEKESEHKVVPKELIALTIMSLV